MPDEIVPFSLSLSTDSMPDEIVPADSNLLSPPVRPSPPLALTEAGRIAPQTTSVANARVPVNTNRCGSIGNNAVGDNVKAPAWNLRPGGANEAGWVLGAQSWPALSESLPGSFVRPSLSDSAKELPLASSSTAPLCGGDASSSSSSNNAPRAPVRAPISPEAPPLHEHRRSDRFVPPSHTGAIHRRGNNTYSSQQRGNRSWDAHNGHYRNQRHDEGRSYGGHNPRGPGHNLYTRMPLPRLPGLVEQPFLPPPTSAWVPYVYMPPRAQAQPPVSLIGYNGGGPAYNAQFVPYLDTYTRVPLDTYRMPFSNPQRPPVASSAIRIRSPPVDDQQLSLKRQIEYYFSVDNLCTDIFLRSKMDDHGWVPISLIATFNRIKRVTTSTTEILNALRGSTELDIQVQAGKVRRRKDWTRWLLPSTKNGHGSTPRSATNHDDSVIHLMQALGSEDYSRQTAMSGTQTEVLDTTGSASGSCDDQQEKDPSQLEELCHSGSDHEICSSEKS